MKNFISKLTIAIIALVICVGTLAFVPRPQAQASETEGKEIDLYFIAGQSNAVGSTKIKGGDGYFYSTCGDNVDNTQYENVYYAGQPHRNVLGQTGGNVNITSYTPVTQGQGFNSANIGPELGMAQYLNSKYTGSKKAAIIKSAAGGTALLKHWDTLQSIEDIAKNWANASHNEKYGTWYPESLWNTKDAGGKVADLWNEYYNEPTGLQYRAFVDFVREQYRYLVSDGYTKINFKALIWMQGESDRNSPTEYQRVFKIFCEDIRRNFTELSGEDQSDMPVVMGEISETFGSYSTMDVNKAFIKMQNDALLTVNNLYLINSSRLWINDMNSDGSNKVIGSDVSHWNYPDMVEIGNLFGETAYKAAPNVRRMYMTTSRSATEVGSNPDGRFTTSSYLLDGEDSVTIRITTEKKYKVADFGIWDGVNAQSKQSKVAEMQHTCDGTRSYVVELDVPDEGNMNLYINYGDAKKYEVTSKTADTTYGEAPSKIMMENTGVAYENADFTFRANPKANGKVKTVKINGITVPDVEGLENIKIANVGDYLAGKTSYEIEVEYGKADILKATNLKRTFIIGQEFAVGEDATVTLESGDDGSVRTLSEGDYDFDATNYVKGKTGIYEVKLVRMGAIAYSYTVEVVLPVLQVEGMRLGFKLGDALSYEGAVVYYYDYENKKIVLDSDDYTMSCEGYNANKEGYYTVTVTPDSSVRAAAGSVTVRVVKPATNVTISGNKTVFVLGEAFETGNMVVSATVGGEQKTFAASEYTVDSSAFKPNEKGTYDIVVMVNGADDYTYQVQVVDKGTLSISGNKTSFYIGSAFELGSATVVLTDALGNPVTLSAFQYTVDSSDYDANTVGTYTIVISAPKANDLTYEVRVKDLAVLSVSGQKTSFANGEAFTLGNIVVTATDTDGARVLNRSEYIVNSTAYNAASSGEYTIVVSASGCQPVSYTVTVREKATLRVSGQKTAFTLEDRFSRVGMTVVKVEGDEETPLVYNQDYTVDSSAFQRGVAGTYTITINANGCEPYTYTVTVGAASSAASSGCAGKAYEVMMLVCAMCAIAFVAMKGGK